MPQDALQANFEKLKSELIEKIRPILPIASFQKTGNYPISVSLIPEVAGANSQAWKETQRLAREHWPYRDRVIDGFADSGPRFSFQNQNQLPPSKAITFHLNPAQQMNRLSLALRI